jgi:outer membrane lipoprotein SlyB
MGVVESVRQVQLEGTKTPVGTIAGAAVGGIAGSNIGGGKGRAVGAILGAVAGGVAGSAIEEGVTKKNGLEITVKLNGGRMIAVIQEADEDIRPGDRVRVLSGGGVTRVTRN